MEKKKKKKKLKLNARRIIVLLILALIIFLIIFGIIKLFKNSFSKEIVAGNYSNMGLVAKDKKNIYYNKYEKGIVKIDGKEEKQLTNNTAYSMTIVGNKIYYLTVSSENTIDLNYVTTNGEEASKIKTLYTSISKFYINDGYVYYASDKGTSGLSKLSLETLEETTLLQANIQDFVLDNGLIYYTDNVGYLYSINLEGLNKKTITKDYNIKNIQILKKWIYYYDDQENALCKINKNGSSKTIVTNFVKNETYNVTSKGIYYLDLENMKICKCDLKGKKSNAITSLSATTTRINIADGVMYYLDTSKDETQIHQMYRIKANGKETKSIEY